MCELIDLYTPTGTKRMSHVGSDMNKMVEEEVSSLCLHPLQNKVLAAIYKQKLRALRSRDCETPLEPETKEGHFEKTNTCTGRRLTDYDPSYRLKAALFSCKLNSSSTCPWSCHSLFCRGIHAHPCPWYHSTEVQGSPDFPGTSQTTQ